MFFSLNLDDLKHSLISGCCTFAGFFLAGIDITIVKAVILPVFFFCVSKAIDVFLQIYFHRNKATGENEVTPNKMTIWQRLKLYLIFKFHFWRKK